MKICFFSHGSGTNQDGATLSMLNVMECLARRGHDVLCIMAKDINLNKYKSYPNIRFIFMPSYDMRLDLSRDNFKVNFKYYVKDKLNWFIGKRITRLLKNESIDVIHINGLNNGIGAIVARRLGIPYVWHIRQLMQEDLGQRLYNQRRVWPLVKQADSVIAISETVRTKFIKEFNRDIEVVYNGVPIEQYIVEDHSILDSNMIRLILPGRITEGKGQMDAIKAIEILVKRGLINIHLIIVGHAQTAYADDLKSYVRDCNLSEYVEFQDHNPDLRSLRGSCDIGLTCSRNEAFGRVTVENQMAGLLAIGADTGGTVELIDDGRNGLLYRQGDFESLAERIEWAANNRIEARTMAENGKADSLKYFSIDRVVDQVTLIYDRITG